MLGKIKPREQAGRDVFARYKAQVRSAAIAALAILEGKIDRVYCDLHDDFVVRYKLDEGYQYSFFQVKTNNKSNSNWSINDLFGISSAGKKPADLKKMQDSFAGKMFLHTVNFPNSCAEVIFQTNITINDGAEEFIENIVSGNFSAKNTKILFDMFHEVVGDTDKRLSPENIVNCLSKFRVDPDVQYIKNKEHRFDSYAVEHIFKYSEIELTRIENELILLKLVDLVSNKSSGVIAEYDEATIESEAAISIDDLLKVLSISKLAYELLAQNGDEKAIKNVSMIQRALKGTGADSEQLIYCAQCKVSWDIWQRNNRHCLPKYQLLALCNRVNSVLKNVVQMNSVDFSIMITNLEDLKKDLEINGLLFDLNMDELIGAFFSELSKEQI
ncbi:dsDNA nuclease domain-containing protein [Vreelandella glaciei]|uniref:dsDNA nuclease domain-containing protein n=1 Tax=Vreelandella glaciei TaxID=186761 RepID=UPI003002DFFE